MFAGRVVIGAILFGMTGSVPKADLRRYLQAGREALLWKLDGLSEYDVRRPLVPVGTNLLGLVKHVASVEAGYFGATFGQPFEEPLPWLDDGAEPNADMWATAEESREQIVGLYRRVWAHSDVTIEALPLDTIGHVPWWPSERREVTLHRILVHMIAETDRHAGHADIVREPSTGPLGSGRGTTTWRPAIGAGGRAIALDWNVSPRRPARPERSRRLSSTQALLAMLREDDLHRARVPALISVAYGLLQLGAVARNSDQVQWHEAGAWTWSRC